MLVKLRRRFILITMGLVGLVLLIVLSVSVISSYRSAQDRVQTAVDQAMDRGPDNEIRPWVGRLDAGMLWLEPDQNTTRGKVIAGTQIDPNLPNVRSQDADRFVPVYVADINLVNQVVISDNSNYVGVDKTMVQEALTYISADIDKNGAANESTKAGFIDDLGLYYRISFSADGHITLAFADNTSVMSDTLRLAGISALIWIVAMLVLFFISLLLSQIAMRPAIEAWDRQRRFISDASHELKTPLTVILANNSLLRAHPHKTIAEQEQWIESTQTEAQRMDDLVKDLLLLAQTDEEEQRAAVKPTSLIVNLSSLVEQNLLQFEAVFFERGVKLESAIASDISVEGNADELGRLMQILLDNASKYAGGDPSRVEVGLCRENGNKSRAVLTVQNSGEPIAAETLPHLFDRFYRGDQSHSDTEGSGLGLSLAQAIVTAHHGKIEVDSNAETGTTFTVRI